MKEKELKKYLNKSFSMKPIPSETTQSLHESTLRLIDHFMNLQIDGKKIQCPYFLNKATKVRAALGVLIGKGTPEDIEEEAKIISLKHHLDLASIPQEKLKEFLVDNNLGIDCSGLAYHILHQEVRATKAKPLKLFYPHAKSFFRKILVRLRPAENCSVETLVSDMNTKVVQLSQVTPGDMIILLGTGKDHDLNHILVIHAIEYNPLSPVIIHYTHALQWKRDGKYGGGVRKGHIEITDHNTSLLEQTWTENEKTGEENETFWRAKTAQRCEIRRLHAL
ncbi:MAG: hypothetical protein COV59_02330 [Candidatus Magasanikbacteria bacterium CG11_big_fil_rev_8_21_14_0_20_39_34]|uniref:NlpC/P60 domain-containing protein n=1 Tax=Candidatus Magasanikbacteria bacterium CG11_big_fil_rev_8_21_14_0_20_39_34 TaxID=1974653 RepID=A0A2H0N540_9BACT|nr:MAG: hypothetical protein COV59_02330 [Candidatus Magasanikbacteria bacterium CG11_big_fil_rev_8_21_14_0_20_39_34]